MRERMKTAPPPATVDTTSKTMPPAAAFLLDLGLVVVFAALGRGSHAEGIDPAGVLGTAWPFLVGTTVGWAGAWWLRKTPPVNAQDGVLVWLSTVAVGMALRALTGAGTAWSFTAVAMLVTAVLLLGWRFVADLVEARRD